MTFNEETLNKETLYTVKLINLERHEVRLYDGNHSIREIVHHAPGVGIQVIKDHKIILVKQYRKAVEEAILEVPAGLVEPEEDFLAAAKRELAEETQLQGAKWKTLNHFYVSPGFLDEEIHMFSCREVTQLDNPPAQDDDEHVELVELSLAAAQQAVKDGLIRDMKTIYAINQWEIEELRNE